MYIKLIFFGIYFFCISENLFSQLALKEDLTTLHESKFLQFTAESNANDDSLDAIRKRRLLPKNISLMEKAFWGENGFFRLTNIAPLTLESRKKELEVRRIMLTAHQIVGITTLGLMISTIVVGQKYIDGDVSLYDTKRRLGNYTVIAYMTSAAFSLFAPPPALRRDEWNSVSTHKLLAIIHFAGMIATPILANRIAGTSGDYDKKVRAHQTAAYITTAAFTASILSIAF